MLDFCQRINIGYMLRRQLPVIVGYKLKAYKEVGSYIYIACICIEQLFGMSPFQNSTINRYLEFETNRISKQYETIYCINMICLVSFVLTIDSQTTSNITFVVLYKYYAQQKKTC